MFYSRQLRQGHSLLAMKQRQKSAKAFLDFNSCNKHPSSPSSVGICPHCLSDRLMKLACSDCGQRRVFSCSCSEISSSSFRNSCSKADVGSHVGRFSFSIDSDKLVGGGRRSFVGLWRMKRLFTKRRNENSEMGSFRSTAVDEQYQGAGEGGFAEILLDDENGVGLKMEDGGACSFVEEKDQRDSWYDPCYKQDLEVDKIASLRSGSCRITMKERRLKQAKLWSWISKFR